MPEGWEAPPWERSVPYIDHPDRLPSYPLPTTQPLRVEGTGGVSFLFFPSLNALKGEKLASGGRGGGRDWREKGGREESVLTDESEPAKGKDGLQITPSPVRPGGHSTALLPPAKRSPQPLGGGGRGPHLINPFGSSPNWFCRQGRGG